ncbi:MAG: S8 family peptidase [Planctomycetota bacterium]|jgi:hypothetical protein
MNRKIIIFMIIPLLTNTIAQAEPTEENGIDTNVTGEWITVDFVKEVDSFNPTQQSVKEKFFLKGLSFQSNFSVRYVLENNTGSPIQWEPGKIHVSPERPALYHIKNIDDCDYLFCEWISGDVTERGMKPSYYVLKKGALEHKPTGVPSGNFRVIKTIEQVDPYDDVRWKDLSGIQNLKNDLVRSLTFNQDTIWPEQSVGTKSIDWVANKILDSSMNPGLGVHKLHQMGITGKGVNVAIIDQPSYLKHPEFAGKIVEYYDTGCETDESSMHGPAVISLLVGTNCGTAPGARVYYAAAPSWKKDAAYYAKALDWIIEKNKKLSGPDKIRVVSVSAAPSGQGSPFDKNNAMWDSACARATAEGIMILDCTDDKSRGYIGRCWFDVGNSENVTKCNPWGPPNKDFTVNPDFVCIMAPSSPRTTAEDKDDGGFSYQYCGRGGLSWAIPYAAGVYAMGWQLWPEATPDQLKELLFKSAYTNKDGASFINPSRFIKLVQKATAQ